MAAVPKRLKAIVEAAEAEGWTYDVTARNHPRLSPPDGILDPYRENRPAAPVTFGSTPSDHRGDQNAIVILRRLGVVLPRKGDPTKKEKR